MRLEVLESIVSKYRSEAWMHERLARLVARFLGAEVDRHFSQSRSPVLHDSRHRAKNPNSLYLNLLSGRYDVPWRETADLDALELWGRVKDLAGVRLIFYFRDNLDSFMDEKKKGALARWFGQKSIDELKDMSSIAFNDSRNRVKEVFGYSSYHFPVHVTPDTDFFRSLTAEDQRRFPRKFECEVQMRTVLQHAWAEAEHDLRYKGSRASVREDRLWGVVSAMLEGADYLIAKRRDAAAPQEVGSVSDQESGERSLLRDAREACHGSVLCVGTNCFHYLLLHDHKGGRIQVEVSRMLFDVNAAMEHRTGVKDYKRQILSQLRSTDPAFVASMLYDSTVVRVNGWDESTRSISVQPALYSDQMVTNHRKALEQTIGGVAVRRLAHQGTDESISGQRLLSFKDSPLSNTIGVSCVVRTADDAWVVVRRAASLAYEADRLGCSVSGSLAWEEPGRRDVECIQEWLVEGLSRECLEELGFEPSAEHIQYLAFCRELGRGGKPQFFYFIDMKRGNDGLGSERLRSCWQMYGTGEHSKLHFLQHSEAMDLVSEDENVLGRVILSMDPSNATPSEELRTNLALALEFANGIN